MGGVDLALSQGKMLRAGDRSWISAQAESLYVEETSKPQEEALKKEVVEKTESAQRLLYEGFCNETC